MARPRETRERELKLDVSPGFALPDLPGEPLPGRTFTSTYHDTADRALARAGVTLRRRVESRKGLWQLKLPAVGERLELEAPGGASAPPRELADLLVGLLRGRELAPVAVLRTVREGVRAADGGRPVADVVLDAVAVLEGRRVRDRFVELEVEALDGGADALPGLERALLEAGAARGDGRPKVFRALGFAPEAPAAPCREARPEEHVRAAVAAQLAAVLAHDPGTRLGEDAEELHQLRVATRRLRAVLRAARPLLDPDWTSSLRDELRWLGGALGPVRDHDVLLARLEAEVEALDGPERPAAGRLLTLLREEREHARTTLREAMSSERYAGLLERLERAAEALPVRAEGPALRDVAAAEFRKLRRAVRALPPEPADDELHAVRIRDKRARYAAELAGPTVGRRAARFVRRAKRFQDVVGDHQDAVVAEERIRALLARTRSTGAHVAGGRLIERARSRRREARAAFPAAWAKLERSGRRAWA